ncbi:MAG: VWA domain-containing protein [Terriglobales bacterium]
MSIPSSGFGNIGVSALGSAGGGTAMGLISAEQMGNNLWGLVSEGQNRSPLESPSGSISKLDLKAPGNARREYEKGYKLLMQKDYKGAIEHLEIAITEYPDFVAAHNALGTAYLKLGQDNQARDQYAKAVLLDDHLPTSYLNLGCAQLALKDYHAAEESTQKASALAPLDLQLATALTYTQFMNRDYSALLTTVQAVHSRKHKGAAMVHYFAAAAWDSENNPHEAENELQTLLKEDPKSPAADQARLILTQIKLDQANGGAKKAPQPAALALENTFEVNQVQAGPAKNAATERLQMAMQKAREEKQIAEASVEPEPACATCAAASSPTATLPAPAPSALRPTSSSNLFTLRKVVDEVAVFFAATDHGKSVTDLTRDEIGIRDNEKSPAVITGFRNEADLPLRLGIVIDTSESIAQRFSFEQHAAVNFLQKVVTNKDDTAFVVGVSNSVLLVQDSTSDQARASTAINQLAPGGGTALWDAVNFAAGKLANQPETKPVARMLVIISDGQDNSSSVTLKDAIATAERGEVFVYTVSTHEFNNTDPYALVSDSSAVGDRALKVLAERTGGAAFIPGSLTGLNHGLEELEQVIRSRYLISYKPAGFKHDGQFRAIEIRARKSGHNLRVYARKGYYSNTASSGDGDF